MMNRRDAIRAVMAMPAVASVSVARAEPNDVIVFECDARITMEMAERIKADASRVWPNRKIVVLDKNMRLKVVKEG